MLRRVLAVALSLALVAALSACGNKQSRITHAETEGIYIDLGRLKYQVEISRTLNPADPEDSEYLKGVTAQLGTADVWFAIFVRVQNESNKLQKPAVAINNNPVVTTTGMPIRRTPLKAWIRPATAFQKTIEINSSQR